MAIIEEQVGWKCPKCNEVVLLAKDRLCGNCPSCGNDLIPTSQDSGGPHNRYDTDTSSPSGAKSFVIVIIVGIIVFCGVALFRNLKHPAPISSPSAPTSESATNTVSDSTIRDVAKDMRYEISRRADTNFSEDDYFYLLKAAKAHFKDSGNEAKLLGDFIDDFSVEEIVTGGQFSFSVSAAVKENPTSGAITSYLVGIHNYPRALSQTVGAVAEKMVSLGWRSYY